MATAPSAPEGVPQAYWSSYAARLRAYNNSLIVPVNPSAAAGPKTTKRGTTIINYAEDGFDDYLMDDDDDDSRRRGGLRASRRVVQGGDDARGSAPGTPGAEVAERVSKDTFEPVDVQAVWREWQGKARFPRSDIANHAQACLPATLIPIRLDIEIPAFLPLPAIGPPIGPMVGAHAHNAQFDMTNPMYRTPEMTVPYRLRDTFLWNLHEAIITTDMFAINMVQDLDLPIRNTVAAEISKQIRTQLEEYAGVALHPLFHPTASNTSTASAAATQAPPSKTAASRSDTPSKGGGETGRSKDVTAVATAISPDSDEYNPDDTYRCIVNLNINLGARLFTDKFEWSLLHPPGVAEVFARQTCADLGLTGEWVPSMTHAIYEAVLRLKKEACESGGLVAGFGYGSGLGEFPNDAAVPYASTATDGGSGGAAGWRYDPDHLGDAWEPKVEILSKEEIEKREGDRERQLRRLRRETARFSSNTGMAGGVPLGFGFSGFGGLVEEEERMGRGERMKKKRRASPTRGTPDVGGNSASGSGGYGGGGTLTDAERSTWRCAHCRTWGTTVWAVRDGPHGPRSLCNNCGYLYERDRKLPRWTKLLHAGDQLLV